MAAKQVHPTEGSVIAEHNDRPSESSNPPDLRIVAIGASAGGLESLERLFTHLPPDTGMAFVVLQHLSPDFKSLMDELLSRRTQMRIRLAEHDMAVEPNTVYLLPPMKEMIVRHRRLLLNDRDPRLGLTLPIDLFFRSLAQDIGEKAIAVVLSGSGSDGSRGVQEINRAGGTVFCESPDTAQFNGMPLSAIRTGAVEQVLAPDEIAMTLGAIGRGDPAAATHDPEEDRGVDTILRLLRDEYAIDFSHYKMSTVTRRIERRLALNRSLDIDMYVEQLRNDPRELSSLYEDLLIGVTRFFRDESAFDALEQRIIPDLIERTAADEPIRVWIPGCATGQEAYSLAMLLHEGLAARRRPLNIKILATDVHKASLEVASAGIYSEEQLAGVGQDRLQRFFTLKSQGYQISQSLRECIVFAPHNLLRDAPFTKLDLITCRNLLIYFQPHAQKTVLTLFHFALKPGGVMFLGSSESPGGLIDEFDPVDEHARIYRKRRDIGLPRDLKLPLPRAGSAPRLLPTGSRSVGVGQQTLAVYDRLLDRFMPPSFLIDEHGQLIDSFGGADSLLKVKSRRPSPNLLDMLGDELRSTVAGILSRVQRDTESLRFPSVPIPGHTSRFSLIAEPMRDPRGTLTHILLSLVDAHAPAATALVPPFTDVPAPQSIEAAESLGTAVAGLTREQIQALEEELTYTKEHLQAALQEHEAANEELQATNEELIASNEELQSTNEELHSVNEELYTVNAEYQKKNVELQEVHDDIEHLLNGTEVATMFLDRQLCIRKFTPRIAETFRVIPSDIGRPLRTFTHDLSHATLMTDVDQVLQSGVPHEVQTWDKRGRCYFLRILPYRARRPDRSDTSGAPDGVVVTMTDISPLEQVRSKLAQLSAIVESADEAIIGKSLDGIITTWNNGATRLYGYHAEEAYGRHASFLAPPGMKDAIDTILRQIRDGRPVERVETRRVRKDGTLVDVSVTYSPIIDASGMITGTSAISRDITQLVRARQEIADREERIRLLLDSTAEAIYGIDLTGAVTFCNSSCARLLGYQSPADLIGKQMHPLTHHTRPDGSPYPPEQSPIYRAMRNREGAHVDNEVLWRADGRSFPAEYWSHPIIRTGEVIGAVVTFLDITERRKAEREVQDGVRRREQFLAMLSHELRNPLAAILSATRLLDNGAWPDEDAAEAGRVVERQARHMARLLDDLLDVARITRGRIVLRSEKLDLRDTTRSAVESLGPFLEEHGTRLIIEMDDLPILVLGDPTRLQQVQANLLSNASKYSPPGSDVRLEVRCEGQYAVIRVRDGGRGIEPDVLPRIFDLFVQGRQSIERPEGGLGLGLTLAKSLVELHQGTIDAQSAGAGLGSVFTVRLPLASTLAASPPVMSRPPVRTVVLVEDQPDARRMMQLFLEGEGVRVHAAENGVNGIELIEKVRPDLALVDLGLPVMSGFDLARQIRSKPENKDMWLVALSGYGQDSDIQAALDAATPTSPNLGQDSDIQAALDAGFDAHLTKPPDHARLQAILSGTAGRAAYLPVD